LKSSSDSLSDSTRRKDSSNDTHRNKVNLNMDFWTDFCVFLYLIHILYTHKANFGENKNNALCSKMQKRPTDISAMSSLSQVKKKNYPYELKLYA